MSQFRLTTNNKVDYFKAGFFIDIGGIILTEESESDSKNAGGNVP